MGKWKPRKKPGLFYVYLDCDFNKFPKDDAVHITYPIFAGISSLRFTVMPSFFQSLRIQPFITVPDGLLWIDDGLS